MNILLTGTSGFIGRNIAAALAMAGHQVRPVSRHHGFDFCRLLTEDDWAPHLDGVDAVINSVGVIGERGTQRFVPLHTQAPVALFRACAKAGVRRVVQISALGADETAFSAYHLSKRAADEALRGLDLDWFVLRPSLIYGRGGTSAELFMRVAAGPWVIPVLGDGQQALQPIHIRDVVATVMKCISLPTARQTIDLVGSETIVFSEWLQRMRQAQGLPRARLLPIPFPLAMAVAYLARHMSPLLQPENLRMLQAGYRADAQPFAQFLGRSPLRVQSPLFFSDVASEGSCA